MLRAVVANSINTADQGIYDLSLLVKHHCKNVTGNNYKVSLTSKYLGCVHYRYSFIDLSLVSFKVACIVIENLFNIIADYGELVYHYCSVLRISSVLLLQHIKN